MQIRSLDHAALLVRDVERSRHFYVQVLGMEELSRGYGTHLAFEVDDLKDAQQQLKAHNVAIVGGPRPRGDGVMQLYVCDPDGYVVELFAWQK